MLTWHDILYYVRLFFRWWFVIALSVALAAGTAWIMTSDQPDVFFSQATLRVGNNFEVAAPSQTQVSLGNVLADYYASLVRREVILGPVAEQLQLSFPWTLIRDRMLSTRIDRGANLLEIKITDSNPERAAAIANAISSQLIAYTPNAPEKVAAQQAEIGRQLEASQANIQAVETKIAELEDRLSSLSSAIDISDVQTQLDALQRTRQSYLDEYANLIALSNQTSVNSLTFFEQAQPALEPLPKKRALTLAIAGAGGLLMAIVAVLVLDRLDERWRNGNELLSRTGIKSLGDVPDGPAPRPGAMFGSGAREKALNRAFSNMVLAAKNKLPRTLLVSSPQPSTARSALAIDIAQQYARTGHRVLLVDTESEPAHIPGLLGQRYTGASPLGRNGGGFDDPGSIWSYVHSTSISNLLVLSGRAAGYESFSSLVPLVFWPDMVEHLRKAADVVIFDGPGALAGPEASLLAPLVDGVLLVLNGKKDSRSVAIRSREQLTSETDAKFLGAIVTSHTGGGKQDPSAAGEQRGNFRIALSRGGITITMGERRRAIAASDDGHYNGAQHLLSPPTIYVDAAEPVAAEPGAQTERGAGDEGAHLTWEDLLSLEVGGRLPAHAESAPSQPGTSASRPAPGAHDHAATAPALHPAGVIITPPPAGSTMPPGGLSGAEDRGPRPDRQRRARIANSRRGGRPGRTSHSDER